MAVWNRRRAFLLGSGIGAVAPLVTLASGTFTVFYAPLWQRVVFYPGFVSGGLFYQCCQGWVEGSWASDYGYLAAGVLGVAGAYGLFALAIREIIVRRPTPAP